MNKLFFSLIIIALTNLIPGRGHCQTQSIKLTQLERGSVKGLVGVTRSSDGKQRYATYVNIADACRITTPAPTGNTTNLSEFVVKCGTDSVWYIDYEGRSLFLGTQAGGTGVADRDWLEIGNNQVPDNIRDSIYTDNYASVNLRLVWPNAQFLVGDSIASNGGNIVTLGNRECRIGFYRLTGPAWSSIGQEGASLTARLGTGTSTFIVQSAGGVSSSQPAGPYRNIVVVGTDSTIQLHDYPRSRNDTAQIVNFLYTDAIGIMRSSPVTELPSGGGGSQPARQIVYGTGSGVSSESGFEYNPTTNRVSLGNSLPLAPVHIGDAASNPSSETVVLVSRNLTDTGVQGHAYSDGSIVSNGQSYNAYDARTTITANTIGAGRHYAGFQAAPTISATLEDYYGHYDGAIISAGNTVNNYYAALFRAPTTGSIGTYRGVQVANVNNAANAVGFQLDNFTATTSARGLLINNINSPGANGIRVTSVNGTNARTIYTEGINQFHRTESSGNVDHFEMTMGSVGVGSQQRFSYGSSGWYFAGIASEVKTGLRGDLVFQVNASGSSGIGNLVERARLTDGGVFNVFSGFRVNNAATTGQVLRGNGTNFVSSVLNPSDLGQQSATTGAFLTWSGTAWAGQEAFGDVYGPVGNLQLTAGSIQPADHANISGTGTEGFQPYWTGTTWIYSDKRQSAYTIETGTGTVSASSNRRNTVINPGSTQASMTINLHPAGTPSEGQEVLLTFVNTVTTLTIASNGTAAVLGAPTTIAAGNSISFKYYALIGTNGTWIRTD